MSKTRRERRAEVIKRLKDAKETDPAWKQYSVYDMLNMLLGEADRSWVPNNDYDDLIDLLSEDECSETMIDDFWRGCGKCGYVWEYMYGIGRGDGPKFCPSCGRFIVRTKHGEE